MVTTLEERVPLQGILAATDLHEAVEHFLDHCDMAAKADDVTSLTVNGHELIHTFRDGRTAE